MTRGGRDPRPARGAAAGALLVGVGAAVGVAGAFRPLTRRWPAAVVTSVPSYLAAEAPGACVMTTAALAGLAWRRGAMRTRAGRAGLALAAGALGALAVLGLRARTTDAVLAGALRADLGPAAPTVEPRRRRPRRHRVVRDVVYGPDPAVHRLDLWRRPGTPAGAPVLVQIHGGAWSSGRKGTEGRPLMAHLVERGWVCVAVDYRLGPGERWPAMIVDVERALAWVHAHLGAGFVAVSGGSAGAHLAALAALTPGRWSGAGPVRVDAAVVLYGIYDLTSDDGSGTLEDLLATTMMPGRLEQDPGPWRAASPALRVHAQAPPFLVLHGAADAVVAPEQSRAFVRALRAVSRAPVVYAELPHAQHAFDAVPSARTLATVRAAAAFLDAARRGVGGAR